MSPPAIRLKPFAALLTCLFAITAALNAQVTISNTGGSGSSGILMTNGSSVATSGSQVSIWADSGTTRGILNNGGFASAGAVPIAVWPCTAGSNIGGIVYGMTGTTGVNGYQKETCFGGNNSGIAMLTENSSGAPSWVLAPLNTGATAHKWLNSYTASTGAFGVAQPAISDLNAIYSAPLSLSSNTLSITGAAGQVLAGATPAFTATPTLGVPSSSTGTLAFANAGSAFTITLTPASLSSANRTYTIPDGGGSSNIGLTTGTLTSGNYASWDANGNAKDSGANAGPYSIPWLTVPFASTSNKSGFSATANQETLWGIVLTFPVTTTQVEYDVSTQDNSAALYGLGILNSAGTVVVHIGPTAGSTLMTTGDHLVSWVEGSTTLQPGKYYLVLTSSCTSSCAKLFGAQGALNFLENVSVAVTSGGTVKSITPPADSYSWNGTTPAWSVH